MELINKCKSLAQRTHQSSLDWGEIKRCCEMANITATKIIQPVLTRWNSNCMMLESILKMRPGLVICQDSDDVREELRSLFPDESEFEFIKAVLPFLKECKRNSERWSADKSVTVASFQQDLVSLNLFCKLIIFYNYLF